ncbi:CPBP family intramembrane metalloprotease [Vannielia litorea]|uniref:CPBP family intramembrane glutamic endopeptidase n=1 Tax=Vannielia litorea TaxID=1217970 RepID=UPI001C96938D|nr:type II CAAX endopeptidase family protein [Vannielia litorea]MBY6155443.1 CPBP family intramembrane metalloprotease [Vannielia litorea]
MAYERLNEFTAPARAAPDLWRIGAVLGLMFVVVMMLQQLVFILLAALGGQDAVRAVFEAEGTSPGQTLAALFSHGLFAVALAIALRAVHWRGFLSLFGAGAHAAGDFFRVIYWLVPLYVAAIAVLPTEYDIIRNEAMTTNRWMLYLPLALAAVAVQAGTEEVFFRGYLTQQIAAGTKPGNWAWMAVPAILFALLHWTASAGDNAIWFVLWAFAFGLAAADLTARAGNLGPALALHIVNNAVALLGVAVPGPVAGLALYHTPFGADAGVIPGLMPVEFALLFVAWLAARVAIRG